MPFLLIKSMKKLLFFYFIVSFSVFSQGNLKIANIGNLKTTGGKIIKNCKISYRTFGKMNENRSNGILFPTWFGGKSKDLMGNAGTLIDTTKYYLILVDALGNGVSSSPSNTVGFPDITIKDMVNAEHQLLTKTLSINHLYAVMGISMGGMQTFEWLTSYPDFMEKAIPIVGTPKQSFYDKILWKTEWNIIEQAGKNPKARQEAMKQVAMVHNLNLFTPLHWNNIQKAENADAQIKKAGEDYMKGNYSENWICQIKAMLSQDIYQTSGKNLENLKDFLKAKILVVVATQDNMVNPVAAMEFSKSLGTDYLELTGECGHVATACENEKMKNAIQAFFN